MCPNTCRFLTACGFMFVLTATAAAQNPVANDDIAMTSSTSSVQVDVLCNDQTGWSGAPLDPTTVEIVSMPVSGTAMVNSSTGVITYDPVPGLWGMAEIGYGAYDLDGNPTNIATVYIWVEHYPPTANDDMAMTGYDQPVDIPLLANDWSGTGAIDSGSVSITSPPTYGTVSVGTNGTVTYTPGGVESVTDEFEYTISDEYGVESPPASVDVFVINYVPEITGFTNWETSAGYWYFEGYVNDEHPEDCTVEFGGILAGHSAVTPGSDGRFSFVVNLGYVNTARATAIATDDADQDSEEAETLVYSYY